MPALDPRTLPLIKGASAEDALLAEHNLMLARHKIAAMEAALMEAVAIVPEIKEIVPWP